MPRLIDADALQFHDVDFMYLPPILMVSKHDIDAAPTVDAVPVVRCRDCKHGKPVPEQAAKDFTDKAMSCESQRGDWKMVYGFSVVAVDGYCDEGERKEPADGRTD